MYQLWVRYVYLADHELQTTELWNSLSPNHAQNNTHFYQAA
jgi:hypothetical protein